ncbi:hypothetical protein QBC35DRAFT_452351 [Podospora australis]|uniref:Uncharacterized protein n=1 Tax=Podospora australis TaxID=1536484 RepID=A0AAN6WU19_9PEZI|nr:hypothetical protein QBC35DRAFT_452351 [Podospora australis]
MAAAVCSHSGSGIVNPFDNHGDAGHFIASHAPLVGSAGFVGYSVKAADGSGTTLCLRLLASNPYMAPFSSNMALAAILTSDDPVDQGDYDTLYKKSDQTSDQHQFSGKTVKVRAAIGTADEATATYTIIFE